MERFRQITMDDHAKNETERMLEAKIEEYNNCFIVDKEKLKRLLDDDFEKKKIKLQSAQQQNETLRSFNKFQEKQKAALTQLRIGEELRTSQSRFQPKLMKLPIMGDTTMLPNFEFPTLEDIKQFPIERVIKLKTIEMMGDSALTKLKMFFTNGVESSAYQSKGQNCKDYTTEVDTTKRIKKISIKIRSSDNLIWGMEF